MNECRSERLQLEGRADREPAVSSPPRACIGHYAPVHGLCGLIVVQLVRRPDQGVALGPRESSCPADPGLRSWMVEWLGWRGRPAEIFVEQ